MCEAPEGPLRQLTPDPLTAGWADTSRPAPQRNRKFIAIPSASWAYNARMISSDSSGRSLQLPILEPLNASPPVSALQPSDTDFLSRLGQSLAGMNQPTRQPNGPVAATALPMSMEEAHQRGWDELDVVFVTGDAYIDHPSFAMAILGRVLEAAGFRVGIVSQPDWQSCDDWRRFGRPRLFFAISAGNMDSMINHYTANKKVRNDDAYSPGGRIGLRPDRATLVLLPAGPRSVSRACR